MITTKEVKIKIQNELTSTFIENELKNMNLDVLCWAITNYDENFYTLNVSVVEY